MATTYIHAVDGDPTNPDNWDNGVPGAGDDAVIPRTATRDMLGGTLDYQLNSWYVQDGCNIKIGGVSTPVTFSTDELLHYGTGDSYYADSAGTTLNVVIACSDRNAMVTLSGNTFVTVLILRGRTFIAGDVGLIDDLNISHIDDRLDSWVRLTSGMTGVTRAKLKSGIVDSAAPIADLFLGGGEWLQKGTTAITRAHPMGGTLKYETEGTLDDCFAFPGSTIDFLTGGNVKTITDLYQFPGSNVAYSARGQGQAIENDFDYSK